MIRVTKRKEHTRMAELKNICGKIPLELHTKVRQEIEERQISTQEFIQQVIEEHFMEKGEMNMVKRTIAVQVSEEFFARLKKAVAWKGMKQNAFLISVIEAAIKEAEALMEAEEQESLTDAEEAVNGEMSEIEGDDGAEQEEAAEKPEIGETEPQGAATEEEAESEETEPDEDTEAEPEEPDGETEAEKDEEMERSEEEAETGEDGTYEE